MRPGRGWTNTCFTSCAARSLSVPVTISSVSRSFHTQSGAVLYSAGGRANSARIRSECVGSVVAVADNARTKPTSAKDLVGIMTASLRTRAHL